MGYVKRPMRSILIGEISIEEPGRYEVYLANGNVMEVLRVGDADPSAAAARREAADGAFHECVSCTCCGECSCAAESRGKCSPCGRFERWSQDAERLLEQYGAALASPEGWFVQSSAGLVHEVRCGSLKSVRRRAEELLEQGCLHRFESEVRPRELLRREQVTGRRRCRVCAPEISLQAPRVGDRRGSDGRFQKQ